MSRLGRLPTFLNAAVTAQVERDQIFTRVLRVLRSDNEVSGGEGGIRTRYAKGENKGAEGNGRRERATTGRLSRTKC